jgi:hypothetical protein
VATALALVEWAAGVKRILRSALEVDAICVTGPARRGERD